MPVELRKRKAPPPAPPPPKKRATKAAAKIQEAVKEAVEPKEDKSTTPAQTTGAAPAPTSAPAIPKGKVSVGDTIDLASFGGEVTLNDGTTATLASLVEKSESGVVLFTYPAASTPGCTTQACLFRDSYKPLTATGLAIYGLSRDTPAKNTTFQTKQKLPYPLLCDPKGTLIAAINLTKAPNKTQRGVFVVSKKGEVLLAEPGSPAGSFQAVKKLVEASGTTNDADTEEEQELEKKDEAKDGDKE
ncbi:thioredoxin-like protein [Coniella lustricola]|uniref:thioredoxin-dependent peroxiredoxin n=1 Tax=Coniella lustricola TaxID=2025994 RepID=A0A2T3AHA0_9PEZI|nr:thioredoxin-like protein [Coniella lustricola]